MWSLNRTSLFYPLQSLRMYAALPTRLHTPPWRSQRPFSGTMYGERACG